MNGQIFATGILISFQANSWVIEFFLKKRYCGKHKKIQEFHINLCFHFLISEPLHLEIKVLLGFDLKSSEVKGRFPL